MPWPCMRNLLAGAGSPKLQLVRDQCPTQEVFAFSFWVCCLVLLRGAFGALVVAEWRISVSDTPKLCICASLHLLLPLNDSGNGR